jgi:hypothetical protein
MSGQILHKIMHHPMAGKVMAGVLESNWGGGSSWDAGLLNDATFSDNSLGDGFAVWDKNAGTLTVYGENSSSHRGVANFELVGLNDGETYRLSMAVDPLIDTEQRFQGVAIDVNVAVGFPETVLATNLNQSAGAVSYDFTVAGTPRYLQFYTSSTLTGTIRVSSVFLERLP